MSEQVIKVRKALKLTQAQLAMLIGVNPHTVSKYERGKLAPGAYQAALLEAFDAAGRLDGIPSLLTGSGVPRTLYTILHSALENHDT